MIYDTLKAMVEAERPVVVATVIRGAAVGAKLLIGEDGTREGELSGLERGLVEAEALARLARGQAGTSTIGEDEVFFDVYPAPPTMLIVGAVHIAIPLVTFAKVLGYRTVVIDARGTFATPERFSHADELIFAWPDEALVGRLNSSSVVVLLTHDPKLDDPALLVALPSAARYVGALGSPNTHAKRVTRLREAGVPEEQIARLHAPIGLKIGARTPEEIAVSIVAEVVAARRAESKAPSLADAS